MKKLYILFILMLSQLRADWIHRVYNDTDVVVTIKTINGSGQASYCMVGPRSGWNINFYGACIQGMVAKVDDKFKDALGQRASGTKEVADAIYFPVGSNQCSWKKVRIIYDEKNVKNGRTFRIVEENYSANNDFSGYRAAPPARPKYQNF